MAKSRHSTKKVNKKSRKYVCRQRKRIGGTQRKAAAAAANMGLRQDPAYDFYANYRTGVPCDTAGQSKHCCCAVWDWLFPPGGATPMELPRGVGHWRP